MKSGNEKIILAVLIAIVVVWGNYFGYNWLAKKQKIMQADRLELIQSQQDAQADLQDEATWTQRRGWIDQNEPIGGDEATLKPEVFEAVRKGALDNKLDPSSNEINSVQSTPAGTRVNLTITVKGSMKSICNWLADLQKPGNFYAVSSFSLRVDPDDQKAMLCTVQMGRYFKGGS